MRHLLCARPLVALAPPTDRVWRGMLEFCQSRVEKSIRRTSRHGPRDGLSDARVGEIEHALWYNIRITQAQINKRNI